VEAAHAVAFDEGNHVVFEAGEVVGRWRHLLVYFCIVCLKGEKISTQPSAFGIQPGMAGLSFQVVELAACRSG
jgi:hypothetical protein